MNQISRTHPVARLLRILNGSEAFVAALAYVGVTLILIADVLSRELFNKAILGGTQVAVLLAAVAAFLGYGVATAAGTHLRPGLLDWIFPESWEAAIGRISDFLAAVAFLFFSWHAIEFVASTYKWGDRVEVLYVFLWPFQMVIPYAFLSCALRHLIFAIWPALKPVTEVESLDRASKSKSGGSGVSELRGD